MPRAWQLWGDVWLIVFRSPGEWIGFGFDPGWEVRFVLAGWVLRIDWGPF